METDMAAAFDVLLETMEGERLRMADVIHEVVVRGDYEEVQSLISKSGRIEHLRSVVRELQELWANLDTDVDPADLPRLTRPNISAGPSAQKRQRRRQSATSSRGHEVRLEILRALVELGGSAATRQVLDVVYRNIKDNLTDYDLELLPSGRGVRWDTNARFARGDLVQEGFMRSDSPNGLWEISDAGRQYLEQGNT